MGRRISVALFLLAVAIGVLWLSRLLDHKGLDWAAKFSEVASFAIAAIGLFVAPLGKITEWIRGPRPPSLEEIATARNILHSALSAAWREEGSEVYLDLPMQVRFAPCARPAAETLPRKGAAPGKGPAGSCLGGDFDSIMDAFSQKPRYRRVILGEAGAGKTVLVTELQRKLLEAPGPRDPLAVIVPAAAWRPDRQSMLDWLAKRISADYAVLTVAQARALVASGHILPILDGLDEMPGALRPDAIARINEHGVYRPLVVTSRQNEYRDAVHVCRAEVRGAAPVCIEPLLPDDIRSYLEPSGIKHWAELLTQIASNPGGILATVLNNPLMLWLARVVYQDRSPDELASFDSRASIEDHLLSDFVPAVYGSDLGRPTFRRFRCSAVQAEGWLGHLAWDNYGSYRTSRLRRSDDERGSSVLAWWRFGSVAGRWRLLGVLLRCAVLCVVAADLIVWVLVRQANWRDGAYTGPVKLARLLLGGPLGQLIRPTVHQLVLALPKNALRRTRSDVNNGFHVIGDFASRPYLLVLVVVTVIIIGAFGLSFGPVAPRRLQIRVTWIFRRGLTSCFWTFASALLASFLLLTLTHKHVGEGNFFDARSTWASFGIIALLGLRTVPSAFTQRSDTSGNLSPLESLRLDRQADVVVTVLERSATGAAVWLFAGQPIATAYAVYAVTATLVAVIMGGGQGSASRTYVDARFWLSIRGRLPWRTMAFLADASRRGVLRQVGATYQFRHIRLLEQVSEWRSAPQAARLVRWRGWLSAGLRTLLRRYQQHGSLSLMYMRVWRLLEEEQQKKLREQAARYRRIACIGGNELPPDLADALEELALQLLPIRQERTLTSLRDVLDATLRDVLDAYRALADANPTAYKPRLAWILRAWAHASPPDEAVHAAEEAAEVYRELAIGDAETYLRDFAGTVHDQADHLTRIGRVDDAQRVTNDLVAVCRRLARSDSVSLLPILAESLTDLGKRQWTSMPEDSLASRNEAVAVYRALTEADPARYLSSFISSLATLATSLQALDRRDEELIAIREGIHSYLTHNRDALLIPVRPAEQEADGLESAQEPRTDDWLLGHIDVCDQLTASELTVFRLTLRLWKLGEQEEALEPGRFIYALGFPRATTRWRRLEERDVRRRRWGVRLWRGIVWLMRRKLIQDTLNPQWLNAAQQRLAARLANLSDSLDTVSLRSRIIGQAGARRAAADAVKAQKEAVKIYRAICEQPPSYDAATALETALQTLALRLQAAGEDQGAANAARDASAVRDHWLPDEA